MKIEESLYSALISDATVRGYVYNRVYPLIAPDNADVPFIVYQVIDKAALHTMTDDSDISSTAFQVSAWATNYSTAKALAVAVKTLLTDYGGLFGGLGGVPVQKIIYDGDDDVHDPVTGRFHIPMDFTIWHE